MWQPFFNAGLSAIDLAVSVKKHGRRDDLVMTGPSNTNLMDLRMILIRYRN